MRLLIYFFFFFNDTATTEIYTLSLHDALPISHSGRAETFSELGHCHQLAKVSGGRFPASSMSCASRKSPATTLISRSEEHTSELQSRLHLVCRLLLEKKKQTKTDTKLRTEPSL